MNTDTLQRLLVDQQLDELPPDTAELLDAYVAENPDCLRLRTELTSTLKLIEQTFCTPPLPEGQMPALPASPSVNSSPRGRRIGSGAWLRAGAVAAALALSFLLGGRAARPAVEPLPRPEVIVQAGSRVHDQLESTFWSSTRLLEAASRVRHPVKTKSIGWTAPFSPNWTGERT